MYIACIVETLRIGFCPMIDPEEEIEEAAKPNRREYRDKGY